MRYDLRMRYIRFARESYLVTSVLLAVLACVALYWFHFLEIYFANLVFEYRKHVFLGFFGGVIVLAVMAMLVGENFPNFLDENNRPPRDLYRYFSINYDSCPSHWVAIYIAIMHTMGFALGFMCVFAFVQHFV